MNEIIHAFNLKRQYEAHREEFLRVIDCVCEDSAFCDGKYVREFEQSFAELCSVPYVSCVNSGTSAIFLALLALGVGKGDEVIVPSNSFVATAWGAVYLGAKPVFADCDADTWQLDPAALPSLLTKKTKAIIGVHLYGMPFDIDAVGAFAGEHRLALIEDCAQAHGASYQKKPVGGLCDAGCFSFYPTKNLGAFGEGGCVTLRDIEMKKRIDSLKIHAGTPDADHTETGFNMRMEGLQAAILSCKLKYFAESLARRRSIAERYFAEINNPLIKKQKATAKADGAYHLFVVTVPDRERFLSLLGSRGIKCAVHYRVPCHLQTAFSSHGLCEGSLPNSEYLAAHCVSLPIYPELRDDEVERIIDACNAY